jgi:AAA domain
MRGRKPELVKPSPAKLLLSGDPGAGKTWFALDFPKPVIIDVEGGATEPQYVEKMKAVEAWYVGKEDGSQDFKTVLEIIKELATTKHNYKTLIIDSFSKLYNLTAAIAEEKVGNVYAADKKEAQKPTRQLQIWMDKLDMNILLICHSKAQWKNGQPTGLTTFDGWEKLSYDLNLWLELIQTGRNRSLVVRKSRLAGFLVGNSYPADFDTFAKLYGPEIVNKAPSTLILATPEQIKTLKELVSVFNIPEDAQKAALKKYDVDAYEELSNEQITAIIDSLNSKLPKVSVK